MRPMLFLAALAVLPACTTDADGWPTDPADPLAVELADAEAPAMRPPPGVPLLLDSTDVLAGQQATLRVSEADPGETIRFVRSTTGVGQGPCPPVLGGHCLEVTNAILMGSAAANAQGVATYTFTVPPTVPDGRDVWFEAAAARGQGGVDSVSSAPVHRVTGEVTPVPYRNTWQIDGDPTDWLQEELFETTSGLGLWAISWDDEQLFVGLQHPDVMNGGPQHWVVLYLGTDAPGSMVGLPHNTQQPALPFGASHVVRWKADDSYDSLEVWDGQGWQGTPQWLGTNGSSRAEAYEVVEFGIPWGAIGNPDVVDVHAAMVFEGNGFESTFAGLPSSSFADGYDPDATSFFTFDRQSELPPQLQLP